MNEFIPLAVSFARTDPDSLLFTQTQSILFLNLLVLYVGNCTERMLRKRKFVQVNISGLAVIFSMCMLKKKTQRQKWITCKILN